MNEQEQSRVTSAIVRIALSLNINKIMYRDTRWTLVDQFTKRKTRFSTIWTFENIASFVSFESFNFLTSKKLAPCFLFASFALALPFSLPSIFILTHVSGRPNNCANLCFSHLDKIHKDSRPIQRSFMRRPISKLLPRTRHNEHEHACECV